jgi:UbiD family decarboxylase
LEDVQPEGPFGEWTGYYASNQPAVPVIQIKAVYFRNDPILCGFPLLKPSSGDNLHFSLMRSALIWNALDETGVPDVKAVWCHPAGGRFLTVISIKRRYPRHAKQAGMIASQCRSGAYLGRYVVVVDEDVDITNSWNSCGRSAAVPTRRSPSIFCGALGADPSIRASHAMRSVTAHAP